MNLTLGHAIDRKNNNFNVIRLLAAILVIFGHSFYLFPTGGYNEPLVGLLKGNYTGILAVYIFFFLSGIFIVSSFVN
jgi:peptidoglycan/LPS O-acetylase OafA/YrhL